MHFASVRLLHAQALAHHAITNLIYQPVDEEQLQRGAFIVLLDQPNTADTALLASLTNTLIREYYRQTHADRLSCFEHTLVRLNEQIRQYLQQYDSSVPFQLNGSIVLVLHNEIHITNIGNPYTYLAREDTLLELADHTNDAASSTFSVITSGEIHKDDVLVLTNGFQRTHDLKADILFALTHEPLFESARAFARLLRQRLERNTEAVFIRFSESDTTIQQVYVDRSLETLGERMNNITNSFTKHAHLISSGVTFLAEKTGPAINKARPSQHLPREHTTPVANDTRPDTDTQLHEANKIETIPSGEPFTVRGYWESAPTSPPNQKASPHKLSSPPTTSPQKIALKSHLRQLPIPERLLALSPRTGYMLIGAFFAIALIVRVVNTAPSEDHAARQSAAERDAIITEARDKASDAERAHAEDDIEQAIADYLASKDILNKLTEDNQNEASNALTLRINEAVKTLTNTTALTPSGTIIQLTDPAKKLIPSGSNLYMHTHDDKIATISTAAIPLPNWPDEETVVDAHPYKDGNIAILVRTSDSKLKVYDYSPTINELKELKPSESSNWPSSRLIATYTDHLYFVGDTMYKGVFQNDAFRIIRYATTITTEDVSEIVTNGYFFYALLDQKQLARIDARSPKNPIKITGVPETFFPKSITRLSSDKEGQLALFDAEGQRILMVSTDGVYRRQFTLPTTDTFTDCVVSNSTARCTTTDKELVTFALSES